MQLCKNEAAVASAKAHEGTLNAGSFRSGTIEEKKYAAVVFFFSIFSPSPAPRAIPGVPGYLVDNLKKVFFLFTSFFIFPQNRPIRHDKTQPRCRHVLQRHSVCGQLCWPFRINLGFPNKTSPSRSRSVVTIMCRSRTLLVSSPPSPRHGLGLAPYSHPELEGASSTAASRPRFRYVGVLDLRKMPTDRDFSTYLPHPLSRQGQGVSPPGSRRYSIKY